MYLENLHNKSNMSHVFARSYHLITYIYHWVCNNSNTAIAYPPGVSDSPLIFSGFAFFMTHVIKVHVFPFSVLCCAVHSDFRVKTMFVSSSLPFVF